MGQGGSKGTGARRRSERAKTREEADEDEDDVKRQIDCGSHNQPLIYRLVDVKTGGGQLIELVKSCARQHSSESCQASFSESSRPLSVDELKSQRRLRESALDEQIRELVEPLLYRRGRGKLVPLSRLWSARYGGSSAASNEPADDSGEKSDDEELGLWPAQVKRVCWRLNERGFVGETALHICFLLASPTHMILARTLLRLFPALINDTYTCDKYFGESALHMAIVNEDVRIVKWLLDEGAQVHERCLGNFFLPDDQKTSANLELKRRLRSGTADEQRTSAVGSADLQANQFSSPETSYTGFTYWGEYPLSFAASLGLTDCYKLLLAKGADPNRRDSNGNSTLHMCVIADKLDMFDLCYSNGAHLRSLNKLGLSPLTLAARLRRVQMFFHILRIHRRLEWIFCNVGFLNFPLERIDSISSRDGSCDDASVLAIVVSGKFQKNSNEHLQMLDGLLSDLLQVKWETSLRNKFYTWLFAFVCFLAISTIAYVTRFESGSLQVAAVRQTSEAALIVAVIYYLCVLLERGFLEARKPADSGQQTGGRGRLTMKVLAQAPELTIFTFSCSLILICVPLRWLRLQRAEDFLVAVLLFLLPLKLLFFCRGSKALGSLIVMVYKILVNDVLCFIVFLIIFIAGFAQSFLIIFKTYSKASPPEGVSSAASKQTNDTAKLTNLFESIVRGDSWFLDLCDALITMHMMALNEFSWVVDEFAATDYPQLAQGLFCVYMILVSILLINMLIAMLGKTYQDISSQPNESLRQWARALLTVERICSRPSRLAMLERYSHIIGTSPTKKTHMRCYSSTWALSEADLEEIKAIGRLKREHELNRRRLEVSGRREVEVVV